MSDTLTDQPGEFREYELLEHERIAGTVARLPQAGIPYGSYLLLTLEGGDRLRINATRKHGYTVLGNELERLSVAVGDRVEIAYHGMCSTLDGGRRYRDFTVEVVAASSGQFETDNDADLPPASECVDGGEHDFGPEQEFRGEIIAECRGCNAGYIKAAP